MCVGLGWVEASKQASEEPTSSGHSHLLICQPAQTLMCCHETGSHTHTHTLRSAHTLVQTRASSRLLAASAAGLICERRLSYGCAWIQDTHAHNEAKRCQIGQRACKQLDKCAAAAAAFKRLPAGCVCRVCCLHTHLVL